MAATQAGTLGFLLPHVPCLIKQWWLSVQSQMQLRTLFHFLHYDRFTSDSHHHSQNSHNNLLVSLSVLKFSQFMSHRAAWIVFSCLEIVGLVSAAVEASVRCCLPWMSHFVALMTLHSLWADTRPGFSLTIAWIWVLLDLPHVPHTPSFHLHISTCYTSVSLTRLWAHCHQRKSLIFF